MSGSVTQNPKGEDGSIEHIALNDDVKEDSKMFEAEEAVGETYAAKYDVGMGKYKFASLLCCCFNLSLFLLLFVLIFSFSTGGKVYTTVVGEDTRMDVAL